MSNPSDLPDAPAAANSDDAEDAELRETLLRHYLSTADDKLARVDGFLAALRAQPASAAACEQAWTTLHTLAGNAGTYGFPAISRRALALSRKLKAEGCAPGSLEELAQFRAELAAAFEQARASLKSAT